MLLIASVLTPSLVAPASYYLGIDKGTQSTLGHRVRRHPAARGLSVGAG
jgi:hypothetical protein